MLTILSVGYPFALVERDAVGGAEQVLSSIDAALVKAGHRSIVIAPQGSVCCGDLVAIRRIRGSFDELTMASARAEVRKSIERALSTERIDVVHLHCVDFVHYLPRTARVPILVTLHLWPDAYPPDIFTSPPSNVLFQCVSEAQRAACPPAAQPIVIRNGVDLHRLSPRAEKDGFVLTLGRICPEKGLHVAIDAAREAGMPIVLGGRVFPYAAHQKYFDDAIAPRLCAKVRFVGPLNGSAKRDALASAGCVALPSTVRETSSLVAMEALASGTPVVAFRSPALEDLIEDGRTGWLVEGCHQMRRAFGELDRLSTAACRSAAETRCSAEQMNRSYLDTYGELVDRGRRRRARPQPLDVRVVRSLSERDTIEDDWAGLWA